MYSRRAKLIDIHRLIVIGLILACFTEVLLAQTFNYSWGWKNGKRRAPVLPEIGDRNEPDILDIWQMQRLKNLLELSLCCEQSQSREALESIEDYFNRVKTNTGFATLSNLNSLPKAKI